MTTGKVRVRAKRAGWNEQLTAEQLLDMDPYEYASDELEGELEIVQGEIPGIGPVTVHLVGGHEADPATIEPVTNKSDPAEGGPKVAPEAEARWVARRSGKAKDIGVMPPRVRAQPIDEDEPRGPEALDEHEDQAREDEDAPPRNE